MTTIPRLAERLIDLAGDRSDLDPVVLLPLLKLLTAGEPVNVADLAANVDLDVAALRARLTAAPDTEYDEDGHIIGLGLTLHPTPHRLTVAGQELYTWCAFDTLVDSARPESPRAPRRLTMGHSARYKARSLVRNPRRVNAASSTAFDHPFSCPQIAHNF